MRYGSIAKPHQLMAMRRVLEAYCRQAELEEDSPERSDMATKILALYELGVSDEEAMRKALIPPVTRKGRVAQR